MARTVHAAAFLAAAFAVPWLACSSPSTDCTCLVDNGGERRTLACGETQCVGGTSFACSDKDTVVARGGCTAPPPTTTSPQPGVDSGGPPPDPSCDDLRAFCNTACNNPPSLAADCQSTANSGDVGACSSWQPANGALCKP